MGWDVVDAGDRDAYMKEKLWNPFTFVVEASDDERPPYTLYVTHPQEVNVTELESRTLTGALEEADGLILSMDDRDGKGRQTPWGKAVWERASFLSAASPVVIEPYREVIGPEGNIKRRHPRQRYARLNPSKHGWPDRIGSFKRQATVEVWGDTWEPQYLTEDEYLASTEGGMPQYERGSKWVPFNASRVMYKAGNHWADLTLGRDGGVDLTLGDAEGAGEFEHDSKKEAIAAVLDWSDFLAEGGS